MSHVKKVISIISHWFRNKTRARHLCSSDWFSHQNSKSDWKWKWWWWWRPREGSIQKGNGSKDSLSECWQREERWKRAGRCQFSGLCPSVVPPPPPPSLLLAILCHPTKYQLAGSKTLEKIFRFSLWCLSQFFITLAQTRTKVADTKTICHSGTGLCP